MEGLWPQDPIQPHATTAALQLMQGLRDRSGKWQHRNPGLGKMVTAWTAEHWKEGSGECLHLEWWGDLLPSAADGSAPLMPSHPCGQLRGNPGT